MECTIIGIKESDECVSTLTAPFVENLPTEPTASVFEIVNQNHVNCSLGGEGAGEIVGEGSAKNSEGESIGVIGASKPIDILGDQIFGQGTILKELFELFMLGTTKEILIILLVQFGNPKGSEYRFRAVTDECEKLMNKELQKGQSCKMGVTFEPMGKEVVTAQLEFIYEEMVLLLTDTISVMLQGSGI